MGNGLQIKIDLPTDKELAEMFDAVSLLKRHEVMSATTKAGAKIVLARAKELAPRGTQSDRNKKSNLQKPKKGEENTSAAWNTRLHTTIKMVTRGGNRRSFSIIGPSHPHGNKAYFNSPRSGERKHKLWGKDVGRVRKATRNWIVQAFDETRPQQLSAMKSALTQKVHEMLT